MTTLIAWLSPLPTLLPSSCPTYLRRVCILVGSSHPCRGHCCGCVFRVYRNCPLFGFITYCVRFHYLLRQFSVFFITAVCVSYTFSDRLKCRPISLFNDLIFLFVYAALAAAVPFSCRSISSTICGVMNSFLMFWWCFAG